MFDDVPAIKRSKLSDEVATRLLGLIRGGQLAPGDRLPAERRLAESFQVSRASLRDAIRHLEFLGYLEVRQGDGTVVRVPDAATLTQPFHGMLAGRPHAARDLLQFRRMLEPQVAALAAERRTPEQIERLDAAIDAQTRLVEDGERITGDDDLDFHALVAAIAGNATVLQVLHTLSSLLEELRTAHLPGDRPRLGLRQHAAIVRAIAEGDGDAAASAMREHLDAVEVTGFDRVEARS